MSYCIVQCTVANKKEAVIIAKQLVKLKLIACCNIIPSITSVYKWKNKMYEENEALMIMKTETALFSQIETEIKNIHTYDVPEIICIPITNGSREYLDWVDKQTKNE